MWAAETELNWTMVENLAIKLKCTWDVQFLSLDHSSLAWKLQFNQFLPPIRAASITSRRSQLKHNCRRRCRRPRRRWRRHCGDEYDDGSNINVKIMAQTICYFWFVLLESRSQISGSLLVRVLQCCMQQLSRLLPGAPHYFTDSWNPFSGPSNPS